MASNLVSASADRNSRGFRVLPWVARIISTVILSIMILTGVGSTLTPGEPYPTAAEWVILAFFPIGVCVGYALGWRWPPVGGTRWSAL